jgi:hypothetical protein
MEAISADDGLLAQQAMLRREKALAAIAKTRLPSIIAVQIPVWFAFLMIALILSLPVPKPNPLPYVVAMLGFCIAWTMVIIVRLSRRLEAVVQFIA